MLAWAGACACGCLAWYALVLLRVPGAWPVLREAALLPLGLTPSIGSAAHVRPFWFYAPLFLAVSSPAILLAPLAWARPSLTREIFATPRSRFAPLCLASLWLAFSAIPMKQKHYLAPLLPFLALSLGELVAGLHARRPEIVRAHVRRLGVALLLLAPVVAIALALHLFVAEEAPAALALSVGAIVLAGGGLAFAAARGGHLRTFAAASLLASVTTFTVHEASMRVVQGRFRAGEERVASDRLEHAFARYPLLRRVYAADRD